MGFTIRGVVDHPGTPPPYFKERINTERIVPIAVFPFDIFVRMFSLINEREYISC